MITPEFKSQYEEKLKKSKEKEKKDKDKKKKKDKKEDADDAVPRDKSGKVSKKKGKKGKIDKSSDPLKLTLKNLAWFVLENSAAIDHKMLTAVFQIQF